MGLPGTIETPRPEDFGLTADDVARAPELVVTRFRPQLFIGLYATVVAVVFGLIFWSSGSIGAAVAFSVIGTAAISVVLIPVLVCVLCASEKAETKMLCRRFPQLTACLAYRDAMTEFKQLTRRSSEEPHDRAWWCRLSGPTLRAQIQRALETRALELSTVADGRTAGFDFVFTDRGGEVLVRCEAGPDPADIGIGRELTACLVETGAARAILVTPAGVSTRLGDYLAGRPINVVDPEKLLGNPAAEL
jgi:hypothetical protein